MVTSTLRDRKKQQTRELISAIATELFFERGFEPTTIADIAVAADVAKMTVTNYFPLKEDLVFDRAEEIAALLADAVTAREGSVLAAVRAEWERRLDAHDPILGFVGRPFADLVTGSSALVARERAIFALQEDRLAEVLVREFASSAADLRPRLAAARLAAVVRILYFEGRRRLSAGEERAVIVRALRRAARAAFGALEPLI